MNRQGNGDGKAIIATLVAKNLWRWRWRNVTVAILAAVSFVLYIVYAGISLAAVASGISRIVPLNTTYYDALVVPAANTRILDVSELPATRYQRDIYSHGEAAYLAPIYSNYGKLEVLALDAQSAFFRFDDEHTDLGRGLRQSTDLVLPSYWAKDYGVQLGDTATIGLFPLEEDKSIAFNVVGMYEGSAETAFPLILAEDLHTIQGNTRPNCYLVNYLRESAALEHLCEWMSAAYPQAVIISSVLPEQMGLDLLDQANAPGASIFFMIGLFAFTSIFTIAFVSFKERKTELATLKSIGMSQQQVTWLFLGEYVISGSLGMGIAYATAIYLCQALPWLSPFWPSAILPAFVEGTIIIVAIMLVSLSYPLILARVATVDQLLYARSIPIWVRRINYLEKLYAYALREQEENIRFVRMPMLDGRLDGICTKKVGDPVKAGEVIAIQEQWNGLNVTETTAICDGEVVDIDINGIIAIIPSEEDAPRHVYSKAILDSERRIHDIFAEARKDR